jgi:hypothetical protein
MVSRSFWVEFFGSLRYRSMSSANRDHWCFHKKNMLGTFYTWSLIPLKTLHDKDYFFFSFICYCWVVVGWQFSFHFKYVPHCREATENSCTCAPAPCWEDSWALTSLPLLGIPVTLPVPTIMPTGHTWTSCSWAVIRHRQGWLFGQIQLRTLLLSPATRLCDRIEACSMVLFYLTFRIVGMSNLTSPSRPQPHEPTSLSKEGLNRGDFKVTLSS